MHRDGAFLLAVGCAPFVAGAIVPADGDIGLLCPFRELTGLPCPFCGATRAFALAARGDPGFVHFNAVWVAVALVAILAGLFALVARRSPLARLNPVLTGAIVVALAWVYALAERATIVA